MSKDKQIERAKGLLGQALSVAYHAMPENKSVAEARKDIHRAIKKLDQVSQKRQERKKMTQTQHQEWWGSITAGTAALAASPMSHEAQQRSLAQLDAMIMAEKEKLEKLQNLSQETDDQMLNE